MIDSLREFSVSKTSIRTSNPFLPAFAQPRTSFVPSFRFDLRFRFDADSRVTRVIIRYGDSHRLSLGVRLNRQIFRFSSRVIAHQALNEFPAAVLGIKNSLVDE